MGRFFDLFYKSNSDEVVVDTKDGPQSVVLRTQLDNPSGYGALLSVDFSACVQTKARSMSSLPFVVVKEGRNGRENLTRHPLAKLLNGMVNEQMSVCDLMDWTVLRRDVFGNAYWFIQWERGKPVAIYPIHAQVEQSFDQTAPAGFKAKYTVLAGDEYVPAGTYFANEVVNIKTHVTKDGRKGVSLASLAAEQIGLSVDLEEFYRNMLRNGNHHMGHVELPEGRLPAKDLDALRAAVDAKSGIDQAGRAAIFGYGAKWVTDNQSMQEASVIEQQQWVLQQVCRACNVPPWKVYDPSGASYQGGQQMRIDYVTDTIVPDVRQIEFALQPVLDSCGYANCSAKFKLHGLMRGDDSTRTAYYRELGYLGTLTRADVRDLEDMEPLGGIDKPLFPLNYGTVNPDGTVNVFNSEQPDGTADGTQMGDIDVSD